MKSPEIGDQSSEGKINPEYKNEALKFIERKNKMSKQIKTSNF